MIENKYLMSPVAIKPASNTTVSLLHTHIHLHRSSSIQQHTMGLLAFITDKLHHTTPMLIHS